MRKLRFREPCRAEHAWDLPLHTVVKKSVYCLCYAEIDHYIRRNITCLNIGKHRVCIPDMI